MEVYKYPPTSSWSNLTKRPNKNAEDLDSLVEEVFQAVREKGDQAVFEYTKLFDKVSLQSLHVLPDEIKDAKELISEELKMAIEMAYSNIFKFHEAQNSEKRVIETSSGIRCWRMERPIEKVGFYIPGGSAPLFSTILMLGVPATIAGCSEIILMTPPDKNGQIHPAILYTANRIGITKIFKVGGIQAIAALTFGTQSVDKVYKIFGPGNQYVTAAKSFAQRAGMNIDMPAGPSEVLIIADKSSIPTFVAADLLAQAEHGPDSQVMLLSDDIEVINSILKALEIQLMSLPRKEITSEAFVNSKCILLTSISDCIDFSNLYAPEHLILAVEDSAYFLEKVMNAGSVFLGNYSCESVGDYASGPNHTLPTNGYASSYSGVSLDSFIKKITVQNISVAGLKNIGSAVEIMAEEEGLFGHKNSVSIRLDQIKRDKENV